MSGRQACDRQPAYEGRQGRRRLRARRWPIRLRPDHRQTGGQSRRGQGQDPWLRHGRAAQFGPSGPHRRLAADGSRSRHRLASLRQQLRRRHPGGAIRRQGTQALRQPGRRRGARPGWHAAGLRYLHIGGGGGQGAGGQEQGRAAARRRGARPCGPAGARPQRLLRPAHGRAPALRRTQGLGLELLRRDPRRFADGRIFEPPEEPDRRPLRQQHAVVLYRSGRLGTCRLFQGGCGAFDGVDPQHAAGQAWR